MDGGGNKAVRKRIAVVRTEDTLLLPGVVTEAPREINNGELVVLGQVCIDGNRLSWLLASD